MSFVQGFDSWESMVAFMEANEQAAARRVDEDQAKISYGDYWVRFYDVPGRVVIFGRVMPLAEIEASETRLGATPEEVAFSIERTKENHEAHLLWGYAYSVIEPQGELGSTHRSEMVQCSQELFDQAKMHGWDIDHLPTQWQREIERLYQQWREHLAKVIGF